MPHTIEMTKDLRDCIHSCLTCFGICKETMAHCLMLGGEHASPRHQRILADCAQSCLTSADFMLRMSSYHPHYCNLCAEVCKECAQSCDSMAHGDRTMEQCAETCRSCEQSCRSMANVTA